MGRRLIAKAGIMLENCINKYARTSESSEGRNGRRAFFVDILWMSFIVMFPNLLMTIFYSFISNFMRAGFVLFLI